MTLRIQGVSLRYGGVTALDGISFEVAPGSITGLIGPNGAGKTSLINVVSGLVRPSAGSVRLGDRRLTGLAAHQVARAGVSRTFQHVRLFSDASVIDNVALGFHRWERGTIVEALLRLPRARQDARAARERAIALLGELGLADAAGTPAGALSYGDQRRVEIARALAADPAVMLLDEPAAGLNSAETADLADFLTVLRGRGLAMVIVEHDVDLIMRSSDSVVVLNFGKLIANGAPAEVRRDAAVIEAYLGDEAA